MGKTFEEIGDHWCDDAFGRRSYAAYLTTYLRGKVLGAGAVPTTRPFTMALDANWGSGKTFFIQRWSQDLRESTAEDPGHTVVTFDAWAADYAADPLVAFMSELRAELQRAVKSSGLIPTARAKATKALSKATRNLRKLALPVTGVVAKSLFKKLSGIDLAEVAEATSKSGTAATSSTEDDPVTVGDVVSAKQADAILDKLFTAQMNEHEKRKQSIEDFRKEIEIVLAVLGSRVGYSAPLFIVIDELDRCKPSFAVGLLEAVKHIFGVPGVCVVVATNMDQLAHTVKAVYGEGFDARTYLQRFFDAIYALPTATGPRLLEVMLRDCPVFSDTQRCKWAMPRSGFTEDEYGAGLAGVLAWIFDGLNLDLRSQKQVLEIMEAAALGIETGRTIHVPWLAVVCGLWHSNREAFQKTEALARAGSLGDEVWKPLGFERVSRQYHQRNYHRASSSYPSVSLRDLCAVYCSKASQDPTALRARLGDESSSFSSLVENELAIDVEYSRVPSATKSLGLIEYFELVRTAGHFDRRGYG